MDSGWSLFYCNAQEMTEKKTKKYTNICINIKIVHQSAFGSHLQTSSQKNEIFCTMNSCMQTRLPLLLLRLFMFWEDVSSNLQYREWREQSINLPNVGQTAEAIQWLMHAVALWVSYCGWREGKSAQGHYLHSDRCRASFQ